MPFPKFLYGEYDNEADIGVLVFEDIQPLGYEVVDPDIKRISSQNRIELVISTLASFHALCTAFELSLDKTLEETFPFLNTEGNIWFHADMQIYLDEMYNTCLEFLKSVPGQEETSKWFEQRMKHPEELQNSQIQGLKTLLHGDLCHNNLFFKRSCNDNMILGGWQMCHYGSPATDLCFFLCSSTTTSFRSVNFKL